MLGVLEKSSADLFIENGALNSSRQIPYQGPTPTTHNQSVTTFQNPYTLPEALCQQHFINDVHDRHNLERRTEQINRFLGQPLVEPDESLCVIHGLKQMSVTIGTMQGTPQVVFPRAPATYSSDKLRAMGQRLFRLHLLRATVFDTASHLSVPSSHIEYRLLLIDERKLILGFMRAHLLYDCVVPFVGVFRAPPQTMMIPDLLAQKIRDSSCVAGFYTLIGLLLAKHGESVTNTILTTKILDGPRGITHMAISQMADAK